MVPYQSYPFQATHGPLVQWVCIGTIKSSEGIDGSRANHKDMSMYLDPFIDKMCDVWRAIKAIDNLGKRQRVMLNFKAIMMWTMHVRLEYGYLRKHSVQGYQA